MKTVYVVVYYAPNDAGDDADLLIEGIFETKEDAQKYIDKDTRFKSHYEIRDWYSYYEKGSV